MALPISLEWSVQFIESNVFWEANQQRWTHYVATHLWTSLHLTPFCGDSQRTFCTMRQLKNAGTERTHHEHEHKSPLTCCKTLSKRLNKVWSYAKPAARMAVSIATRYRLDGSGIESRWGRDFLHPSRLALGPTQPPVQWVPGLSQR